MVWSMWTSSLERTFFGKRLGKILPRHLRQVGQRDLHEQSSPPLKYGDGPRPWGSWYSWMFILAISNSHGKWSSTDSSQSNRSTWVPHAWFLGRYSTVGDGIIGKTTCHMSPCIGLDQVFADHVLTVIYCIHCIRFISSQPPEWHPILELFDGADNVLPDLPELCPTSGSSDLSDRPSCRTSAQRRYIITN